MFINYVIFDAGIEDYYMERQRLNTAQRGELWRRYDLCWQFAH